MLTLDICPDSSAFSLTSALRIVRCSTQRERSLNMYLLLNSVRLGLASVVASAGQSRQGEGPTELADILKLGRGCVLPPQ